MEKKKIKVKLNDINNTVIICDAGDDIEKVKRIYKEKLRPGYSIREDHHNHINPKL